MSIFVARVAGKGTETFAKSFKSEKAARKWLLERFEGPQVFHNQTPPEQGEFCLDGLSGRVFELEIVDEFDEEEDED